MLFGRAGHHSSNKDKKLFKVSALHYSVMIALSSMAAIPAHAQQSDEGFNIPQVTVTAERRETKIEKTPVAVSVVAKEDLIKPGVLLFNDLSGQIPGFVAPVPTPGTLFIRGIGTSSPTYYPAVALYVDDVYIPRIRANKLYASFSDVERIEVLRGPQGTLYGQNSSGGAFKLVSRDPTDEVSGFVSGSVGNYGALGARAYVTGAINPGVLSASVAYTREKDDGYTKNPVLGRNTNSVDVEQIRAKFKYTPSDDFEALFSIDATHDGSSNGDYSPLNYGARDPRISYEERRPESDVDIWGTSLRLTKKIDARHTLKSITAYRGFKEGYAPNLSDGVPTDESGFILGLDQTQLSQEVQLLADYGRLNYTVGAVVFKENFKVNRPGWARGTTPGAGITYSGTGSEVDNFNVGVFGQANYQLTDKLGLTAGLRFNRFSQDFNAFGYSSNIQNQNTGILWATDKKKYDSEAWTPKLGFNYKWNDDVFSYVSVTRGEKDGGYNPVSARQSIAEVPVDPEKVTSYEIGTKTSAFGGRLKTSTALFYNRYKDYHAIIGNPIINGVLYSGSVTANAGSATTYGAEFEATIFPTRQLEWNVSAALLHAKFDEFANPTGASGSDYKGNTLPFSPSFTFGTRVAYTIPLKDVGTIRLNASARYLSKVFTTVDNAAETTTPKQTYVNLGGNYTTQDGKWNTSLEIANLFDKTYALNFVNTSIAQSARYNAPRTIRLAIRRDF